MLPAPTAAQAEAMMQTMTRLHALHEQLRAQTRERMLAALSPQHRNFVATLVGQLAVAPTPDRALTARQIDAALSPNERQSVLRIDADSRIAAAGLARQMQVQVESMLTPEQHSALERQMAQMKSDIEKRLSPEQRAALQRSAPGMPSLPLVLGGGGFGPGSGDVDAGSVLLRTLTTSALIPYKFSVNGVYGAGAVRSERIGPP